MAIDEQPKSLEQIVLSILVEPPRSYERNDGCCPFCDNYIDDDKNQHMPWCKIIELARAMGLEITSSERTYQLSERIGGGTKTETYSTYKLENDAAPASSQEPEQAVLSFPDRETWTQVLNHAATNMLASFQILAKNLEEAAAKIKAQNSPDNTY